MAEDTKERNAELTGAVKTTKRGKLIRGELVRQKIQGRNNRPHMPDRGNWEISSKTRDTLTQNRNGAKQK
eukprot:15996379-Heterocapsa_arctica.AAC.1